jgi:hypothetical protein
VAVEDIRTKADQPLPELLAELWENGEKLVRGELALARSELEQKISVLKVRLLSYAFAGSIVLLGIATFVDAGSRGRPTSRSSGSSSCRPRRDSRCSEHRRTAATGYRETRRGN